MRKESRTQTDQLKNDGFLVEKSAAKQCRRSVAYYCSAVNSKKNAKLNQIGAQ